MVGMKAEAQPVVRRHYVDADGACLASLAMRCVGEAFTQTTEEMTGSLPFSSSATIRVTCALFRVECEHFAVKYWSSPRRCRRAWPAMRRAAQRRLVNAVVVGERGVIAGIMPR